MNPASNLKKVTSATIAALLAPYLSGTPEPPVGWPHLYKQLIEYIELLLKWNARTNLTAIRDPEEIVRRHFGESLFAAQHLGPCSTLLDFGSGAGFPGLPIQLFRPDIHVTLAESQGKKAAFLREAVRSLNLQTEVISARVETLPTSLTYEIVTLRAVDNMEAAIQEAATRAEKQILLLTTSGGQAASLISGIFEPVERFAIPNSNEGFLEMFERR
jgi:16S rRNA (guanine527-N7)-methyltransferase